MSAVDQIREKLKRYPHLRFNATPRSVTVLPASTDGFHVQLDEDDKGYTVSFAGWHEQFASQDEALACFAFGLSEACRLRVISRGRFDYKWILQSLKDGKWQDDSETGLLMFPFWLPRRERYLQNHLAPAMQVQ